MNMSKSYIRVRIKCGALTVLLTCLFTRFNGFRFIRNNLLLQGVAQLPRPWHFVCVQPWPTEDQTVRSQPIQERTLLLHSRGSLHGGLAGREEETGSKKWVSYTQLHYYERIKNKSSSEWPLSVLYSADQKPPSWRLPGSRLRISNTDILSVSL